MQHGHVFFEGVSDQPKWFDRFLKERDLLGSVLQSKRRFNGDSVMISRNKSKSLINI